MGHLAKSRPRAHFFARAQRFQTHLNTKSTMQLQPPKVQEQRESPKGNFPYCSPLIEPYPQATHFFEILTATASQFTPSCLLDLLEKLAFSPKSKAFFTMIENENLQRFKC